MAQTQNWFATTDDMSLILDWLRESQAEIVGMPSFPAKLPLDGRELILHYPSIGPIEYWPGNIRLSDYPENSARWRQAVLLRGRQVCNRREVDADRSAAAGLLLPELRDCAIWVSGCLWFPGSKIRESFPELARVCSRFERWIRKFPTVFDNSKGEDKGPYSYQLCMEGIIQRVVALPAAESLLQQGAFMVGHMTSPTCYNDFKRRLELASAKRTVPQGKRNRFIFT